MHHGPEPSPVEPIQELHAEIIHFVRLLKSAASSAAVPEQSALLLLWPLLHDGPMRLRELAESKGVDASTVSRQAAHLVRAGLIRRNPDPDDGRAAQLCLTEQGRQFCHQLMQARMRAIEAALRDWSPQRIATLAELLRDFNRAIETHQRTSVPIPTAAPGGAQPQETS